MSGFEYIVSNAGFSNPSATDKYRQFVGLHGSQRQSKSATFTIPDTTPEETYFAVTGVGFQPDLIIVCSSHEFGGGGGQQVHSIGGAARGKQFGTKLDYPSYLGGRSGSTRYAWHSDSQIIPEIAEFSSFDADGFTLNIPNPLLNSDADPDGSGTYSLGCTYFAARGAGVYDCGTALSPAASGSVSYTGIGFRPAAVMFFSAHVPTLNARSNLGARMGIGASDDALRQYSDWCGSGSGDIYTNCASRQTALSILADASGVACFGGHGFCHPEAIAEAVLTSMDADGFTLSWTVDSTWAEGFTQREFSWLAFENAEVGRFVYNHTSADYFAGTHFTVPTDAGTKGLIFYMTDLGHDLLTQNTPSTEGAVLALGACGDDLSGQWMLSWGDVSRGIGFGLPSPFGGIDTIHGSFGCQHRSVGGFSLEDFDCGEIVTEVREFMVGMNYRNAVRRGPRGRMLHGFS